MTVREKIISKLKSLSKNGSVILHTKDVHRRIIPDGTGSCSVDRYLRLLRKDGLIDYPDPRANFYFYIITIKDEDYYIENRRTK